MSSLCSIHSPNLVCIVESWLSSVITNLDIALNNYYLFRRDRNCHGGGIVIYIRSHLIASEIPLPSEIELLLLSVKFKHCSLTVGTYYRPPSSPHDLNNLLDVLSSFNPSIFLNFILFGDFNVNYNCTSPLKLIIDAISSSFNLQQIVNDPTHFSYSGIPSTIDLVFIPSTIEISSCEVLPPVSNSDHNSILVARIRMNYSLYNLFAYKVQHTNSE